MQSELHTVIQADSDDTSQHSQNAQRKRGARYISPEVTNKKKLQLYNKIYDQRLKGPSSTLESKASQKKQNQKILNKYHTKQIKQEANESCTERDQIENEGSSIQVAQSHRSQQRKNRQKFVS